MLNLDEQYRRETYAGTFRDEPIT